LYIPAYRGGKNERTNAIEKLFDIIGEKIKISGDIGNQVIIIIIQI
jgi:hypothetical protein